MNSQEKRSRPWTTSSIIAIGALSLNASAFQATLSVEVLRNGDFEQSHVETADYGQDMYGSFWHHGEGRIADFPAGGPVTNRALQLDDLQDVVYQKFAAWLYYDHFIPQNSIGDTTGMVVSGKFRYTGDTSFKAKLVIEETREDIRCAYWGFTQEFKPNQTPEPALNVQDGEQQVSWSYMSQDVNGWNTLQKQLEPERFRWPADADNPSVDIRPFRQTAAVGETAARVFDVPRAGRVFVQTRVASRPFNYHDNDNADYAASEPWFRILRYNGVPGAAGVTLQETYVDVAVGRDASGVDQDFDFGRYIDVLATDFLVFETYETAALTSGQRSEAISLMPRISYDARETVYLFAPTVGTMPASTDMRNYADGLDTPLADTWYPFSFDVGQDYASWLSAQHPLEPSHGPIPQLAIKLELEEAAGNFEVYFDELSVTTDFYNPSVAKFRDEVITEFQRLGDNFLYHQATQAPNNSLPYHPYAVYDMDAVYGNGPLGVMTASTTRTGFGGIATTIMKLSEGHWFPVLTPWMLEQADLFVDQRNRDLGFWRDVDLTSIPTFPPINLASGDKVNAKSIVDACALFDMTADLTYLDSAYEMANSFYAAHQAGAFSNTNLVMGEYKIDVVGSVTTVVETDYYGDDPSKLRSYSNFATAYAQVLERCNAAPTGRYAQADLDNFEGFLIELTEFVWDSRAYNAFTSQHPSPATQQWQQGWKPYWFFVENMFDDLYGYNAAGLTRVMQALPDLFVGVTSPSIDELLYTSMLDISDEITSALHRGRRINGDAERGWNGILRVIDGTQGTQGYRDELAELYVDLTLHYMHGTQTNNGAWVSGAAANWGDPDYGWAQGGPTSSVNEPKLRGMLKGAFDTVLTNGATASNAAPGRTKEDMFAYLATMVEVNRQHFGHYLERHSTVSDPISQKAYMRVSRNVNPESTVPVDENPFVTLRTADFFAELLQVLNDELSGTTGFHEPVVLVDANVDFLVRDSDGTSDLNDYFVEVTDFDAAWDVQSKTTYSANDLNNSALFTKTSLNANTWKFSRVNPFGLTVGHHYRYRVIAIDNQGNWDCHTRLIDA